MEQHKNKFRLLEIKRIRLNHRPHRNLDPEAVDQMKSSLSIAGQLQPIGVRRHDNGWILIFGHLRLQAAQQLGWKTIQAMEYTETESSELVDLVIWANENLHRSAPELDEMAITVSRLVDADMSHSIIALALGKPIDWVVGMLNVVRNPLVRDLIVSGYLVDVEAGLAFLQLAPNIQKTMLDSREPITRELCERAQTMSVQCRQKKKKPVLQDSFQPLPQSDSTFDLFSPVVKNDGNSSTFNHVRPILNRAR